MAFTNTSQDSTKDRQSAQEIFDSYFQGGAGEGVRCIEVTSDTSQFNI